MIIQELRNHAPFTIFGAAAGVLFVFLFRDLPESQSFNIFYVLHPAHVFLSAVVIASMYKLHGCEEPHRRRDFFIVLIVGCVGSIGLSTLSDSLIPYIAELLLNMPFREPHIGFIEKALLVNPMALLGVLIAWFKPTTKIPHSGHVLVSTWASLFHVMMANVAGLDIMSYVLVFVFLFIAVWFPCCLSDIIFPLLCVKESYKVHLHTHR